MAAVWRTALVLSLAGCALHPVLGKIAWEEARGNLASGECVVALAHVKDCDARFREPQQLCKPASGCPAYLNADQEACLRAASCEMVRAAIDRRDWLCGMSMVGKVQ
jgi:hypothetical protein